MLLILCACVVLGLTTWFSAAAVLPQLRGRWDLGEGAAGLLTVAVQLGFLVGAIAAALTGLPDRVPPRRLIALSGAVAAAMNLALLFLPAGREGGMAAIVLRLGTGVAMAGIYPPALKLVATWFRSGRGAALGAVIGALTLGSALPHAVNALGAGGSGADLPVTGALSWQGVILAASGLTALGAVAAWGLLREGPYPFPTTRFEPREILHAFRQPAVRFATLGYLGHMWELYALWAWILVFLREALSASAAGASALAFAVVAAGAPASVLAGWLADRWGRTATAATLMLLSAVCAATVGLAAGGPAWLLIALAVFWGATALADSAQFSAMVTEVGESRLVGTALTVQLGLGYAVSAAAISLLPVLAGALGGWRWVFLALVPGPLLGTLAMLRLRRRPEASRLAGGRR